MRIVLAATALALACGAASAHVELGKQSAPAGSDFRAVFTVEHGCAGAATTAIRIRLDDRIVSATPVAKQGWMAQVGPAPGKPGTTGAPAPREASWTGGRLDGHTAGTFTLDVKLPDAPAGTVIHFPIVQECGNTSVRWIETPLPGEKPEALGEPAPFVTLTKGSSPPAAVR